MKHLLFKYYRPLHYFNHLLTFFIIVALSLAIPLTYFQKETVEYFFLNFLILFFLLLVLATMVEFFSRGDYIGPLELYDIQVFYKDFYDAAINKKSLLKEFFLTYDQKSKDRFIKVLPRAHGFLLSSIKKQNNVYEITLIDEKKLFEYFFLKFLVRKAIHKLYVKKIKGEYKIIFFI